MFISKKKLFLLFLSIRTLMALLSGSWYVPDETWQSVEIAHGIVWGPDRAYKTWEWDHGLRSYLHPLIFVPGFEFLKLVRLATPFLVALLPRLIQGDQTFSPFKILVKISPYLKISQCLASNSFQGFFHRSLMLQTQFSTNDILPKDQVIFVGSSSSTRPTGMVSTLLN